MLRKRIARVGGLLAVVAVAAPLAASGAPAAGPAKAGKASATKVVIWTDRDRKAAVERVAGQWGRAKGIDIEVVEKDFGKIRDEQKTVAIATAPDVIEGAHD